MKIVEKSFLDRVLGIQEAYFMDDIKEFLQNKDKIKVTGRHLLMGEENYDGAYVTFQDCAILKWTRPGGLSPGCTSGWLRDSTGRINVLLGWDHEKTVVPSMALTRTNLEGKDLTLDWPTIFYKRDTNGCWLTNYQKLHPEGTPLNYQKYKDAMYSIANHLLDQAFRGKDALDLDNLGFNFTASEREVFRQYVGKVNALLYVWRQEMGPAGEIVRDALFPTRTSHKQAEILGDSLAERVERIQEQTLTEFRTN